MWDISSETQTHIPSTCFVLALDLSWAYLRWFVPRPNPGCSSTIFARDYVSRMPNSSHLGHLLSTRGLIPLLIQIAWSSLSFLSNPRHSLRIRHLFFREICQVLQAWVLVPALSWVGVFTFINQWSYRADLRGSHSLVRLSYVPLLRTPGCCQRLHGPDTCEQVMCDVIRELMISKGCDTAVPGPTWISQFADAEVSCTAWCSICIKPMHGFLCTLNHL